MATSKVNKQAKDDAAALRAATVVESAKELCSEWQVFESTTLARTNQELYAILAKVYALYQNANAEKMCLAKVVETMRAELARRDVKVQINTPALTIFVRYVTNSDRKRAYIYASTINAAIDAEVAPDNLAEFIGRSNGVEACKKEYLKKPETIQAAQELEHAIEETTMTLSSMQGYQKVTLPNTTEIELKDGTQFAFVIARVIGNGTLELLRAVPMTTVALEKAAINALAQEVLSLQAQAKVAGQQQAVNDATALAVAVIKDNAAMIE